MLAQNILLKFSGNQSWKALRSKMHFCAIIHCINEYIEKDTLTAIEMKLFLNFDFKRNFI